MISLEQVAYFLLASLGLWAIFTAVRKRRRTAKDREEAEDERATRMQIELVLRENGHVVLQDTLILTSTAQQKSLQGASAGESKSYELEYRFERPTSSLAVKTDGYDIALAMPPYRSSGWDEFAYPWGAKISVKRTLLP